MRRAASDHDNTFAAHKDGEHARDVDCVGCRRPGRGGNRGLQVLPTSGTLGVGAAWNAIKRRFMRRVK